MRLQFERAQISTRRGSSKRSMYPIPSDQRTWPSDFVRRARRAERPQRSAPADHLARNSDRTLGAVRPYCLTATLEQIGDSGLTPPNNATARKVGNPTCRAIPWPVGGVSNRCVILAALIVGGT